MDNSTKQRLVGVLVLIALGTIVLPIVFHHSSKTELTLNIPQNAPPPPPMPEVQIAPPSQNTPLTITPIKQVSTIKETTPAPKIVLKKSVIAPIAPIATGITTVKLKAKPKPAITHTKPTWLIQLGSFSDKTNAEKMVANLKKNGFKAHTTNLKMGSKTLTKVFIGPEYKKESADWIVRKLAKTLHMKGIIVKAKA